MEIGMGGIETGLNKSREFKPIKIEGKKGQEIIEQLLDNMPEQKREGMRELIVSSGDRELVGLLLRMNNLISRRKELYQLYEKAPAKEKIKLLNQMLAKWDDIEGVAGLMDKKIATILLQSIKETLKIKE